MSIFDRFLDAIKLNDDYDDEEDFLDDEDDEEDEEDYEDEKPRGSFFSRFSSGKSRSTRDYDEEDDEDEDDFDFDEEEEELPRKTAKQPAPAASKTVRSSSKTSYSTDRTSARSNAYAERAESSRKEMPKQRPEKKAKPAPARKKGLSPMEVNVIRPTSMDDTKDIADTLMDKCTVVLNLEGIDVDLAQRIIDFTCGTCYALNGGLQKISSYIYILTPADVDISGDVTSILSGAFDIPSMRSPY